MTSYVLKLEGLRGLIINSDGSEFVGEYAYLLDADVEDHDGLGSAQWTAYIAEAKRFPDFADAFNFWRAIPKSRPIRPDGKPNRPLTAFSVSIVDQSQPSVTLPFSIPNA